MRFKSSIAVIGVGRLGGALALALAEKKYEIRQLISRRPEKAQKIAENIQPQPQILAPGELEKISAEIVFVTTPDAEIQNVSKSLAEKLKHQPFVFHTSGALSSAILQDVKARGCRTGSLHPLVSVSDSFTGAEHFKNVFFCVEGDLQACETAEKIVADLAGKSFSIATEYKALYHASAVMASGHLTALVSASIEALTECGLNEREAQEILFPLIDSTARNLAFQTPAEALTGTFARADVETLKRHLDSLRENVSEEVFAIYRQLGLLSLALAKQQGANSKRLDEMKSLLMEEEKENFNNRII